MPLGFEGAVGCWWWSDPLGEQHKQGMYLQETEDWLGNRAYLGARWEIMH